MYVHWPITREFKERWESRGYLNEHCLLHAALWRMRDFPVNRCPGIALRLEEGEMERIDRITIWHCWNGNEDVCDINDLMARARKMREWLVTFLSALEMSRRSGQA